MLKFWRRPHARSCGRIKAVNLRAERWHVPRQCCIPGPSLCVSLYPVSFTFFSSAKSYLRTQRPTSEAVIRTPWSQPPSQSIDINGSAILRTDEPLHPVNSFEHNPAHTPYMLGTPMPVLIPLIVWAPFTLHSLCCTLSAIPYVHLLPTNPQSCCVL